MEKTILITGKQSPLKWNLVESLLNQNKYVVVTKETEDSPIEPTEKLTEFTYSQRSFLSTRTLFFECKNKKREIEHIIIVHSILGQSDVLQGFQSNLIEQKIDEDMKGVLFFVRESLAYLEKRGGGSLNIVLHNTGPDVPGPLEALLFRGIEALGSSLFTYYNLEKYLLRGYISKARNSDEYAEYILKGIEEGHASGKWHKYRSGGKFFSLGGN